jgi:hypothetical protein
MLRIFVGVFALLAVVALVMLWLDLRKPSKRDRNPYLNVDLTDSKSEKD